MIGKETVRGMSSRSVLHAWIVITLCIPHMHYAGGLACRSTLLRRDTTYPLPPSFPPPLPLSSCSPSPLPSLSPVSPPPPSHPYPLLLPVFSPAAPPSRHLIDRLKMSISQRCWHVTFITHIRWQGSLLEPTQPGNAHVLHPLIQPHGVWYALQAYVCTFLSNCSNPAHHGSVMRSCFSACMDNG